MHIFQITWVRRALLILFSGAVYVVGTRVFGSEGVGEESVNNTLHGDGGTASTFLWIALILLIAKTASLVKRWKQPAVLGELLAGVVLGNLALLGISFFEPIKTNNIIHFLAELGVVILLFQIGLESNLHTMRRVGGRAFTVAVLGVIAPFVVGAYVVGPWFFPELSQHAHLF